MAVHFEENFDKRVIWEAKTHTTGNLNYGLELNWPGGVYEIVREDLGQKPEECYNIIKSKNEVGQCEKEK